MKSTTETSGEAVEYHIKVPYCKDCYYWLAVLDNPNGSGDCLHPKMPIGFIADPDFGCVHWQKKDGGREE